MLKAKTIKRMVIICLIVAVLITVKVIWVVSVTIGHGSLEGERKEIVHRANYLTSMVCTSPQDLLNKMPSGIGEQFQGEWALYTCSMTSAALANIAILYPQNKERIRQATLGRRPNGWYLWESEPHLIL